ncbi:hypothetical protein CBP14_18685, partial [Fischerella thermalis WC245]
TLTGSPPGSPGDATCYNCWNPQGRSGSFMPGKESTSPSPHHPTSPTNIQLNSKNTHLVRQRKN